MNSRIANGLGSLFLLSTLALFLAAPAVAQIDELAGRRADGGGVTVDPDFFEFRGVCGMTFMDSLCVTIPEGTVIEAVDIIFLMDVTGSMFDELDEVKTSAVSIMNTIDSLGIDAAYGVGSFADYPHEYDYCGYNAIYGEAVGDYPWNMEQDVTTNTALVETAINGLTIRSGADWPECYTRALYESQFFTFRANTKKIVLMFGDAPTHDCDFYPAQSYGPDPGPNEVAGDLDDLDYQTVVGDLATGNITVLSIDSSLDLPGGDAYENFEYMAVQTGGTHYLLSNAGDIPQAIVDLITGAAQTINWLTLHADPMVPFGTWFSFAPAGYANVTGPVTLCFQIVVTPVNTPVGDFSFDIIVDGDGATLATVPVLVHVIGASAVDATSWSELKGKFRNR